MDSYDAIIEHLREAQRRGLESISGRFDSIVDNLEQATEAAKAAVRDARPVNEGDVFPTHEVEKAIAELRAEAAQAADAAEAAKATADAKPAALAGITLDNLRTLDKARSQSELLRALLPMLAEHVGRAAVLVIREGVVTAWSGIGFEDASKLRSWNGGIASSPDFQRLVDTASPLHLSPASDPLLSKWLQGDEIPGDAVLLPISLRGKLMGIVYLDTAGAPNWDVEAAQALNAVACWLIDNLQNRTTVPSPMLAQVVVPEPKVVDEPPAMPVQPPPPLEVVEEPIIEESVVEEPVAKPQVQAPVVPPEPQLKEAAPSFGGPDDGDSEPAPGDVTEVYFDTEAANDSPAKEAPAEIDYDFEPAPAEPNVAAGFDPSATVQVEVPDQLEARDTAPPSFEAAPEPIAKVVEAPTVQEIDAPPPVRPIEPPAQPVASDSDATEDDARHEEARRFARLLVSEIKLYNEDDVERGRTDKNLGERLKDDIERSREMYQKRIPADVREGNDYFRDELVRILADGDPDALGM